VTRAAVVFDFDGVLADTEGLHLAAFQDTFATRGWTLGRDAYFSRYLGFDDRDLVAEFLADEGVRASAAEQEAIIIDKGRRYDERVASGRVLFPAAAAAVARLGAEFSLAIASGSLRGEILSILRANQLDRAIPIVVGADDVTASKPAPDSYALAVEKLGVPPAAAVAIEDSHWGLVAARAAGLRTIGVTTSYPASALGLAHTVVSSLDEVTPALVRSLISVR
jgi:beta-phosphoglucomutase-like phosphatase (HAD superfamily)